MSANAQGVRFGCLTSLEQQVSFTWVMIEKSLDSNSAQQQCKMFGPQNALVPLDASEVLI
eukprot:1155412-Pelagomonas_calceolata.AAC.3